ncbi:MAG: sodium:calcium antiporter [Cyanobacteriota bacterium]
MEIVFSLIFLFILLGLIVFVCIIFTNAVEHLGSILNLSQGAVGSVLAAVGTALPETLVPIVAILGAYFFKGDIESGHEIGVGAILGAPFLLGTLAMCITGIAVYYYAYKGKRTIDMPVNTSVMKRDMQYFMGVYIIAVGASFLPHMYTKVLVVIILLFIYSRYVYLTVKDDSTDNSEHGELEPLYVSKVLGSGLNAVIIQLLISIGSIILLAHFFVDCIKEIAIHFHISALVLSLIIAPIATELPEKFNSVIWIKGKKDTLALGNITGAMVFQSAIPPVVGILLTPWHLNSTAIVSIVLVYISMSLIYLNLTLNKNVLKPWILIISGVFYLIYILFLTFTIINCP